MSAWIGLCCKLVVMDDGLHSVGVSGSIRLRLPLQDDGTGSIWKEGIWYGPMGAARSYRG